MNLAIIGGYGLLGSTAAFFAGAKGLFDEIYLIGRKQNLLMSHVMDMDQSLRALSRTRVYAGDYTCLEKCDVILFAASMPERAVDNRNEYLNMNIALVEDIAQKISDHCEDKIILCATNPVDIFNYALYKRLGFKREKFLGFGYNDTLRLRWALADYLNKPYEDISAYVLGEHGDLQVPVFSQMQYEGQSLLLDEKQRADIMQTIAGYFRTFQSLDSKRTSGWTSAVGITTIFEAITSNREGYYPCSAILEGEYGLFGVSLGVPVKLGKNGIEEILELSLTKEERTRLEEAASSLRARANEAKLWE